MPPVPPGRRHLAPNGLTRLALVHQPCDAWVDGLASGGLRIPRAVAARR